MFNFSGSDGSVIQSDCVCKSMHCDTTRALADGCLCKDYSPVRQPRLPSSVDGQVLCARGVSVILPKCMQVMEKKNSVCKPEMYEIHTGTKICKIYTGTEMVTVGTNIY